MPRKAYLQKARKILKTRPVLAILGPRQCGKTTLSGEFINGGLRLDLERPSDIAKISADPELYLESVSKAPLILDEVQRMPEIFPILRSEADTRSKMGQFVLLGSSSFQLIKSISESLAGRVGVLDLTPLGLFELDVWETLPRHWLKGGFPNALLGTPKNKLSFEWFEDYTRMLIERDLPTLGVRTTPTLLRRLWVMCAHFHSNILNMHKMASSLDISPHTVKTYLDILEHMFMIRRLPPFFRNMKKRLVKSPKIYIRDSGMFHYFSRILDQQELMAHPDRGKSFEGYVVETVLQINTLYSPEFSPSFFRTSDGVEVDIILERGKKCVPIEIKSTLSPTPKMIKSLEKFISLTKCPRGFVVHLGKETFPLNKKITAVSIYEWHQSGLLPFWT